MNTTPNAISEGYQENYSESSITEQQTLNKGLYITRDLKQNTRNYTSVNWFTALVLWHCIIPTWKYVSIHMIRMIIKYNILIETTVTIIIIRTILDRLIGKM